MVTSVHMRVLHGRGAIIEWAGRVRAFPVEAADGSGGIELSRPGEDEGRVRTGWARFFAGLERRHLVLIVEGREGFAHRLQVDREARRDLPAAAFGPPWYVRLWHEIALAQPRPAVEANGATPTG